MLSYSNQSAMSNEELPLYSEAILGYKAPVIVEKELAQPQSKKSSKMSTLKSILTGDVHKHNPHFVLEESVTGRPHPMRQERSQSTSTQSSTSSSSSSSSPTSSTLKSILTGETHRKYHPMYRLEESVQTTGQMTWMRR